MHSIGDMWGDSHLQWCRAALRFRNVQLSGDRGSCSLVFYPRGNRYRREACLFVRYLNSARLQLFVCSGVEDPDVGLPNRPFFCLQGSASLAHAVYCLQDNALRRLNCGSQEINWHAIILRIAPRWRGGGGFCLLLRYISPPLRYRERSSLRK